jgi:hypothetical protein
MTSFFDLYRPYWQQVTDGQYSLAMESAIDLLSGVKQLAPNEYEKAHKGTPFYIMGFAAFLSHDYEAATFLFDAAAAEDMRNYSGRIDTPALLFMQLDDQSQHQLARDLVVHITATTKELVRNYNGRIGAQTLTANDIRTQFVQPILQAGQPHRRALVTTLVSFIAEWPYRSRLLNLSDAGSREPFFLHLFKGCLLFESLLKQNPTKQLTQTTLGRVLDQDLKAELGLNKVDVREDNFNTIVRSLFPNMDTEASINCTGKTRNTLGHNLVWATARLNAEAYALLVKNIATACIHAISNLYR